MDDTNPEKEEEEMVKWLGYEWNGEVRHASDYFDTIFELTLDLIRKGFAYVDFTPKEMMRENRGTLTKAGMRSTDADHPVEWHLKHFLAMRDGKFADGECVLRARLDMASPNINLRDPVVYRIKRAVHARTGDKWIIYPAYMYAHPASDFLEEISLSICTLEFEDQRPFYNWTIERCTEFFGSKENHHVPVELEFARLELDRGMTSKRKINALVEAGKVDGWDDPRLVTLAALRRRGFTPTSIRKFCEEKNISKANSETPFSRVEDFLRLDLDEKAPRRIIVARPVELEIVGWSEDFETKAANHPKDEFLGSRSFKVTGSWWIDADDVRANGKAEAGFKRVEPAAVFRIMHTGVIYECIDVIENGSGEIIKVIAKVSDKKPRVAIHGISKSIAIPVEILEPDTIPSDDVDPANYLVIRNGYCEPSVMETTGKRFAMAGSLRIGTNPIGLY